MKGPRVLIGIAISLVCGYIAVHGVEWPAVWAALGRVSVPMLLPALGCLSLLFLLRAYRWQQFVKPIRPLPFRPFFSATLIGFMINDVLPLRLGEFVRAYALAHLTGVRMSTAFATSVLERVWDTIAVAIMLACTVPLVPLPVWLIGGIVATLAACGVLLIGGVWLGRRAQRPAWIPHRVAMLIGHFTDGLTAVRSPGAILWVSLVSVTIWVVLAAYYQIMFSACGLTLPLKASLVVTLFTVVSVALPGAPAAVGTFQYAIELALLFFAVPKEEALGFAIVAHAVQVVPVTIVGLIALLRAGLPLWPSQLIPHARAADATPVAPRTDVQAP